MTRPVVRATTAAGHEALVLANQALSVTVLPALGGHVTELVDRASGRDLLWHNPRTAPRPAPHGAHFDDWWSGGWDEIFPSGDRGTLHGEHLPYMGELWCVPWTAETSASGNEAAITASCFGTISAARFERRFWLQGDEPILHVHYRIDNLDVRPLPFTWGIHPAFAVTPAHRIDHPGQEMSVGVSSDPSMGVSGNHYRWPELPDATTASGQRDMRVVRPREDAVFGGHWASDLPEGWLALTDTWNQRGITITFDSKLFRHAWLWQVYGGWRGHQHVALEPWTSRPMQLEHAQADGQAMILQAGDSLETDVAFVLFEGLDAGAAARAQAGGDLGR